MRNKSNTFTTAGSMSRLHKTVVLAILLAPFLAKAQDFSTLNNPASPPNGWLPYGEPIQLSTDQYGFPNSALGPGTVQTANQELYTSLNLMVYKNSVQINNAYDYYLVTGSFRHAVNQPNGANFNTSNWLSVGIFATEMKLILSSNTKGVYLLNYGPVSTVSDTTAGFSVGASLGASSGSSAGANGSVNFGYSFSNSAPSVQFAGSATSNTFTVTTSLPGVTANQANPLQPSYSGYSYAMAVIFQVPAGQGLELNATTGVKWEYDYTRGIPYEHYYAWATGLYNADFQNKQIVQNSSGLCLGVYGGTLANQAYIDLETCSSGKASQLWTYTSTGQLQAGNSTSVADGAVTYCLDAANSVVVSGQHLVIAPCSATRTSQKFQVGEQIYMGEYMDTSKLIGLPPFPLGLIAASVECNTSSLTSFGSTQVQCSDLVNDQPTSNVIQSVPGNLVAGSADANSSGALLMFEAPRVWLTGTYGPVADTTNAANHFFRLQ